jgi:hypothetical protein
MVAWLSLGEFTAVLQNHGAHVQRRPSLPSHLFKLRPGRVLQVLQVLDDLVPQPLDILVLVFKRSDGGGLSAR